MRRLLRWLWKRWQAHVRAGSYASYLKSDYWHKLRVETLGANPRCADCGSPYRLQLHHKFYKRNGVSVLYKERSFPGCLVILCHDCHMSRHRRGIR